MLLSTSGDLAACYSVDTSEKGCLELPHFDKSIKLDGKLDEEIWEKALVVSLDFETSPGENIKPPVKTKVYLFENSHSLFVGFDAQDPNPEKIRDYFLARDNIWESDFVGIKFDTFGESRKAYQFFANVRGIQADAIQEDFKGDDSSWDAIWYSAGSKNSNGFVVEMEIPLTALRFPSTDKKQNWGVEILRFYPRQQFHRIANTPVDRATPCQICQFDKLIGFEKTNISKNIIITPALVATKTETRDISPLSQWESLEEIEPSIDIRWGIAQDIYLNATLNPDFSQVEANDAKLSINNSFSIFNEEKRPFFLEGSDYFNGPSRLVHTQNINEPDYGVKITGQSGSQSYGLISANDKHTQFLIPGNLGSQSISINDLESKNNILRFQSDLGNKNTIGVTATSKSASGYSNKLASIDGKYWVNNEHSLTYQISHTDSSYSEEFLSLNELNDSSITDSNKLSGRAATLDYDFKSRDWNATIKYRNIQEGFRPDLGFVQRSDFIKKIIGGERIWYPDNTSDSWWSKISFGGDWDKSTDQKGFKLEQEFESYLRVSAIYHTQFSFKIINRERYWQDNELEETGNYFKEFLYDFNLSYQPFAGLKLNTQVRWGDTLNIETSALGNSRFISPRIDWQVNSHLLTEIKYTLFEFDLPEGELFGASTTNLKISYLFDERSSLRFSLQRIDVSRNTAIYDLYDSFDQQDTPDSVSKNLAKQLLYSYKVNPQTLLFLGYSENGSQEVANSQMEIEEKNLFFKFSYAWQT